MMRVLVTASVLAAALALPLAAVAAPPHAKAQAATQQAAPPSVGDMVFSELEKRVLRDILGNGRYETTGDGGYRKVARDRRYDDLEKGRDGKFYGGGKDQAQEQNQGRGDGLPPGLQKQLHRKGKLPPGLQKQLQRKGKLPPGLARNPLPYEAVVNLPPPLQGTERAIVDTSVVLLEKGTNVILDVLKDVLARK